MESQGTLLAGMKGFGSVYDCGNCGNIHVQIGPVSIVLEPGAYVQFVAMISTSAANFEIWMEQQSNAGDRRLRGTQTEMDSEGI